MLEIVVLPDLQVLVLDLKDSWESRPEILMDIVIVKEPLLDFRQVNETPNGDCELFHAFCFSFPHVIEEESAKFTVIGFSAQEPQEFTVKLKRSRSLSY